jgi:Hg(II)-responsive transcriptional regulator
MKIGELARQADVAIDTVRYYERQGLLPEAKRTLSGYRRYAAPDVERVRFIRRAKALGFTLSEIGELLALSSRREADMAGMKRAAEAKLVDVDARLAELQRIRGGLEALVASCPGRGELQHCPILGALSGDEP